MRVYTYKSFTVTDLDALQTAFPHLVETVIVPDVVKIRAALKAGFVLPGVQVGVTVEEDTAMVDVPHYLKAKP